MAKSPLSNQKTNSVDQPVSWNWWTCAIRCAHGVSYHTRRPCAAQCTGNCTIRRHPSFRDLPGNLIDPLEKIIFVTHTHWSGLILLSRPYEPYMAGLQNYIFYG